MRFESRFSWGDKVTIDGDRSITATVIGFGFYPHQTVVQCSWFHSGTVIEAWIGDFRLTPEEPE